MEVPIPFSSIQLAVRQVSPRDLDDLGRKAMAAAFTGFLDFDEAAAADNSSDIRQLTESVGVSFTLDSTPARRFSGDASLPRGRYYTLCQDGSRSDGGSLVRELRAYYNPDRAGVVQIFDLTNPRDRAAFTVNAELRTFDPEDLVLAFLPVRRTPNPVAVRLRETVTVPMLVSLPLRIESREFRRVIDLRVPTVADWFARVMSRLPSFPRRSGVESFYQLIPEMLAQQLGGGGLSMAAGLWCREHDVGALIYPSARTDSGVDVDQGDVVSHAGWNIVEYSGAARTDLAAHIDLSDRWADFVGVKREDRDGDADISFREVGIQHVDEGAYRGSWQIFGLKQRQEAHWRFNQVLYALGTCSSDLSDGAVQRLKVWLEHGLVSGHTDQTGAIANLLLEALMGVSDSQRRVLQLADESDRFGDSHTANALREAVHAVMS